MYISVLQGTSFFVQTVKVSMRNLIGAISVWAGTKNSSFPLLKQAVAWSHLRFEHSLHYPVTADVTGLLIALSFDSLVH